MNILFVSAVLPFPLHSGGQIRIYNILKRLSKRHRITLLSFIRDERERDLIKHLDFCQSVRMVMRGRAWQPKYVFGSVLGKYPLLLASYDNAAMRQAIRDTVLRDQIDLIHLEPFYVWPALPKTDLPVVISEHNIEYDVYSEYARRFSLVGMKPFLLWDVGKLKKWERFVWRSADALTAVSASDASVMEAYVNHDVTLVPNGVDLDSFPFRKPNKRKNLTVLFVGNFRWLPNRDAAETLLDHIWPQVRRKYPQSSLLIAGRDIPAGLRGRILARGGQALGNVESIAPVYQRADIFVAPHTISGGTKFKLLEAMASGVPVVTTKQGISGLVAEAGVEYLEAETPEDFVAQISSLWDNPVLARSVAANARTRIEKKYDWNQIALIMEDVWKKTL
ncbi:MAG: glycosyltransferase [Patescibacteria group bacterium]